jgi:hypothetical protein
MIDPRSIVLVGKPTYYWSYLAPVAREFYRRFDEPITVVPLEGTFVDEASYIQPGTLRPYRRAHIAIAFDVWSMIAAWACARTVVYVHHSLVGKGLVFRSDERFWPFALANMLCLPLPERKLDMPARARTKVRIIGHLPFDWFVSETPLPRWQDMLHVWGDNGRRLRVAVLCTHGEFGSVHLLDDIAQIQIPGLDFGVKLHGYLGKRPIPPNMSNFSDCPTSLIVRHSDLVVTDHSTAALEAYVLGVPCICYRSAALTRLQQRYPALSELHYLDDVHVYETIDQLVGLLHNPVHYIKLSVPQKFDTGDSASSRLLNLCISL